MSLALSLLPRRYHQDASDLHPGDRRIQGSELPYELIQCESMRERESYVGHVVVELKMVVDNCMLCMI